LGSCDLGIAIPRHSVEKRRRFRTIMLKNRLLRPDFN
jgi:hypothetical protein